MNKTEFNNLFDDCLAIVAEKYPEYSVRYLKMVLKVSITKQLSRALGNCCYSSDEIKFNARYVDGAKNKEQIKSVKDTILHELAHYVDKCRHSHGDEWQKIAVNLGAAPVSGKSTTIFTKPVHKYTIICPFCGSKAQANRKGRVTACGRCCNLYNDRRYCDRYTYKWIDNDKEDATTFEPKKPIKWMLLALVDGKTMAFNGISRAELFEQARLAGVSNTVIRKGIQKYDPTN